ncbi:uncharacterized protein CELE_T08B6.9 [Caenorhabditis elegans]|uniref:Secreted protein n=1 Tax=Caenorhabditis elegans TaxID=6239 RepID=Q86MH6_CAEEL|nr:Secreted protein [Caenorhabditis elegans]CCD73997.1 Secreted protein [Caenorhabditis elegans]|eukprot:NP_001023366.1 Uncharacterized protein CELE_T08B6.9 [Caenorhabditis elegans]
MLFRNSLLFLCLSVFICIADAGRIHEKLKKVGKRFWNIQPTEEDIYQDKLWHWNDQPDDVINETKWFEARVIAGNMVEMSSAENKNYKLAKAFIEKISDPDMEVEICGSETKLNSFQYDMYMDRESLKYKEVVDLQAINYRVVGSTKETLVVELRFDQVGKDESKTTFIYTLTTKISFDNKFSRFVITKIQQGGSCEDHGIVGFAMLDQETNPESLKTDPSVQGLFNLLIPKYFKFIEKDSKSIPKAWMHALDMDETDIEVFRARESAPVKYTRLQFIYFYLRFAIMWHPKLGDQDYMSIQMLSQDESTLSARVTMKLQIGRNKTALVHEWNFKITAKYNQRDNKKWYITGLEFLCPPTITDYMDLSLLAYREVVAEKFLLSLNSQVEPVKWYSSMEFLRYFTKYGEFTSETCNTGEVVTKDDLKNLETSMFSSDALYNITIHKYKIDYTDIPLPATETTHFKMGTRAKGYYSTAGINCNWHQLDWDFDIEWDKMHQFYYIKYLKMSCPKGMRLAEDDYLKVSPDSKELNY